MCKLAEFDKSEANPNNNLMMRQAGLSNTFLCVLFTKFTVGVRTKKCVHQTGGWKEGRLGATTRRPLNKFVPPTPASPISCPITHCTYKPHTVCCADTQ